MLSNTPAAELMQLILALNKTEKRYFRLYASQRLQRGESIYLQLYDHLIAQGEWSEGSIRAAFAGKRFLSQLVVARTRLQELILASLRDYDHAFNYHLEFSRRMDEIELLYRRRHFDLCERLVRTALRKAAELDLPLESLQLMEWAMRLERQKGGFGSEGRLSQLHAQHAQMLAKITLESHLRKCYDALSVYLPQRASKVGDRSQKIASLMQDSILHTPIAQMAFDAQLIHTYIHQFHARILGDAMGITIANLRIVEIWESRPARIRYGEEQYFAALVNLADSTWQSDSAAVRIPVIAKLKRIAARFKQIQQQQIARILLLDLSQMIFEDAWLEADLLVPKIKAQLQDFGPRIPASNRQGLIGNVITAKFYLEKWADALYWATELETEVGPDAAAQWKNLIRIARWVAWYTLGDHDKLEKALQQQRKTQPTDFIHSYFIHLLQAQREQQEISIIESLRIAVEGQIKQEPTTHLTLLHTWTTAKIHGIPITAAEHIRKNRL